MFVLGDLPFHLLGERWLTPPSRIIPARERVKESATRLNSGPQRRPRAGVPTLSAAARFDAHFRQRIRFNWASRLAVTLLAVIDSSQGAVLETAAGHTTRPGFRAAGGKCLKNGLGSAFIPI